MKLIVLSMLVADAHGFVAPLGRYRSPPMQPAVAAPLLPPQQLFSSRTALRSTAAPVMGLFGLGTPEIAIIAGVAMLILGPDQLKKIAKDVGKVSAELKQVCIFFMISPAATFARCRGARRVGRCRRSSTKAWRWVPPSWNRRRVR